MTELMQQVASGLAIGIVFGILALALAVIVQGTGVLNFAQGEMAAFSALAALLLVDDGISYWIVFPIVVLGSLLVGMGVERVFIRPFERSGEMALITVTLALYLGINALSGLTFGYLPKSVNSPFGSGVIHLAGVVLTAQQIGMAVVAVVVVSAVTALFRFTDVGLRMRAAALNAESSRLVGVNVGRQLMLGWGTAAAVGAVGGMISAPLIGVGPDMMASPVLFAFAGCALGGFQSRVGAFAGGLIVGVVNSVSAAYVPGFGGSLSLLVPFVLITLVLLFRPQGLFSKKEVERV